MNFNNKPIRGLTAQQLLETVALVEQKIKPSQGTPVSNQYLKFGPWLIKKKYASLGGEMPPFLTGVLPSCQKRPDMWFKRWIKAFHPITAHCQADAIRMRHHLRAFYFRPEPFTIKIAVKYSSRENPFDKEISVRKRIVSLGRLHTPRILQIYLDETPPYFMEELIDGNPMTSSDLELLKNLIKNLWKIHDDHGITQHISNHLFPPHTHEIVGTLIKKLSGNIEISENHQYFLEKLKTSMTEEIYFSYSIGHGDLYLHNMLKRGNELYLCDWEFGGQVAIAIDLAHLLIDSFITFKIPLLDFLYNLSQGEKVLFGKELKFAFVLTLLQYYERLLKSSFKDTKVRNAAGKTLTLTMQHFIRE